VARTCLLVVCGAPLARRATDVARALVDAGWELRVAVTPAAEAWVEPASLEAAAEVAVRSAHRSPNEPKDRTRPDVVLVCPATFNTVNKLAVGIADTYAASVLAEALGSRVPIAVVPMVNEKLWGHPAWEPNLAALSASGVTFLDPRTFASHGAAVPSGTGEEITEGFDVAAVVARLDDLI
jgi:phosphopantothenoylcysteine synthetase/decarboxylase